MDADHLARMVAVAFERLTGSGADMISRSDFIAACLGDEIIDLPSLSRLLGRPDSAKHKLLKLDDAQCRLQHAVSSVKRDLRLSSISGHSIAQRCSTSMSLIRSTVIPTGSRDQVPCASPVSKSTYTCAAHQSSPCNDMPEADNATAELQTIEREDAEVAVLYPLGKAALAACRDEVQGAQEVEQRLKHAAAAEVQDALESLQRDFQHRIRALESIDSERRLQALEMRHPVGNDNISLPTLQECSCGEPEITPVSHDALLQTLADKTESLDTAVTALEISVQARLSQQATALQLQFEQIERHIMESFNQLHNPISLETEIRRSSSQRCGSASSEVGTTMKPHALATSSKMGLSKEAPTIVTQENRCTSGRGPLLKCSTVAPCMERLGATAKDDHTAELRHSGNHPLLAGALVPLESMSPRQSTPETFLAHCTPLPLTLGLPLNSQDSICQAIV